jgi:arylsulfatase A-like enzyme
VLAATRDRLPHSQLFLPNWGFLSRGNFPALVTQKTPARYLARDRDHSAKVIAALTKARKQKQHGVFWFHVVEPHRDYRPHPGFDFGDSQAERYYGEVAFDDAIMGRVLAYLRRSGYYDDSLIVLFSDHGEALGEHTGYYGHGISLSGRFGDVPLYVRYPGVSPRVSNAAVSLTSIAPTVLHYVDAPIPGAVSDCSLLLPDSELAHCPKPISISYGLGAETFARVLRGKVRGVPGLEARQADLASWQRYDPELVVVDATHRYLRNLTSGVEHVYDRVHDPAEQDDLAGKRPDLLEAFRAKASAYRKREAERLVCQLRE